MRVAEVASVTPDVAAHMLVNAQWNADAAIETYYESGAPSAVDPTTLQRIEAGELGPDRQTHRHAQPRVMRRKPRAAAAAADGDAKDEAAPAPVIADSKLVARYRSALDTAIKLSVVHNVAPLPGYTAVFCDVSGSMRYAKANTAKGLGRSNVHPYEISMLLGLMIHYVSEQGEIQVFGSRSQKHAVPHCRVEIPSQQRGHILESMQLMRKQADTLGGGNEFFYDWFEDLIERRIKVDRLVVLSDVMIDSLDTHDTGYTHAEDWTIPASCGRTATPSTRTSSSSRSICAARAWPDRLKQPNDILITGYSDRILQFLAQRADAQLLAVEAMNERLTAGTERRRRAAEAEGRSQGPRRERRATGWSWGGGRSMKKWENGGNGAMKYFSNG